MADDMRQAAPGGLKTGAPSLDKDAAAELAGGALTGQHITPGEDWHIRQERDHWVIRNLPAVLLLVNGDTG